MQNYTLWLENVKAAIRAAEVKQKQVNDEYNEVNKILIAVFSRVSRWRSVFD